MKLLIYLSYLFFLSEFILAIVKRSSKSNSSIQNDKGSLILLWITITICFTGGFMFANYRIWELMNFVVYYIGLLFILIGITIRWMAIIQLKKAFTVNVAIVKEHKLKDDGIYRIVRHPSYLGLLIIMVGFSIGMNSVTSIIIVAIPMVIVILYRIYVEEKVLINAFGDDYKVYRTKTKKLIPWLY